MPSKWGAQFDSRVEDMTVGIPVVMRWAYVLIVALLAAVGAYAAAISAEIQSDVTKNAATLSKIADTHVQMAQTQALQQQQITSQQAQIDKFDEFVKSINPTALETQRRLIRVELLLERLLDDQRNGTGKRLHPDNGGGA